MTLRCLRSLIGLDWPKDQMEIVMVDNASIDGLVWKVPRMFPEVRVIESLENEGFARGNNLGMNDLTGVDYVALVNNDAYVEPNWLKAMVGGFDDNKVGATCSKLLFDREFIGFAIETGGRAVDVTAINLNGQDVTTAILFDERVKLHDGEGCRFTVDTRGSFYVEADKVSLPAKFEITLISDQTNEVALSSSDKSERVLVNDIGVSATIYSNSRLRVINNAGGGIFEGLHGGDIGFRELDLGQYNSPREPFSFCGGAVVLKSAFLAEVGLFDDTYFLYYEDLDLSWRGRFRGWCYRYVPEAVVYHAHAFSSGEWSPFFRFWVDRNRRLTLLKNAPARVAAKAVIGGSVWMLRDSIRPIVMSVIRGKRPNLVAAKYRVRQGLSLFKAIPSALRQRHRIGQSKVLPRSFVYDWVSRR